MGIDATPVENVPKTRGWPEHLCVYPGAGPEASIASFTGKV
jgi:hypothetical protein